MALVIEKGLDEVEDELEGKKSESGDCDGDGYCSKKSDTVDCDDNSPDIDCLLPDTPAKGLRKLAYQALKEMAEDEECELQGVLTGKYSAGEFRLAGHWWSTELAGLGAGQYRRASQRPGGGFAGAYQDMAGGDGELRGRFVDPGVAHDIFGVFGGVWSPDELEGDAGNIVGLWHPVRHRDGGVIVGIWSSCLEQPVRPEEPMDSSEGDERD